MSKTTYIRVHKPGDQAWNDAFNERMEMLLSYKHVIDSFDLAECSTYADMATTMLQRPAIHTVDDNDTIPFKKSDVSWSVSMSIPSVALAEISRVDRVVQIHRELMKIKVFNEHRERSRQEYRDGLGFRDKNRFNTDINRMVRKKQHNLLNNIR